MALEGEGVPVPAGTVCPRCGRAVSRFVSSSSPGVPPLPNDVGDDSHTMTVVRLDPKRGADDLWRLDCGCSLTAAETGLVAAGRSRTPRIAGAFDSRWEDAVMPAGHIYDHHTNQVVPAFGVWVRQLAASEAASRKPSVPATPPTVPGTVAPVPGTVAPVPGTVASAKIGPPPRRRLVLD